MDRRQRRDLADSAREVAAWKRRGEEGIARRDRLAAEAAEAIGRLQNRLSPGDGAPAGWSFLAIGKNDLPDLKALASAHGLAPLTPGESAQLSDFLEESAESLKEVRTLVGARRLFADSASRAAAEDAGAFLARLYGWGVSAGLPELIERTSFVPDVRSMTIEDATSPAVGLQQGLDGVGPAATLVSVAALGPAREAISAFATVAADETRLREEAVEAGTAVREAEAWRIVDDMPVNRLRDATRERVKVTPLTDAGYRAVGPVLRDKHRLSQLPGVGQKTARRMQAAALALWQQAMEESPVRIDITLRPDEATLLLWALKAWDEYRRSLGTRASLIQLAGALEPLLGESKAGAAHIVAFGPAGSDLRRDLATIVQLGSSVKGPSVGAVAEDVWADFEARPADYFALLADLGLLTEDDVKSGGDLPAEIVNAVRDFALDTQHLAASLRGYQAFGAKFALVQKKIVLGDEMGLGKTLEALATLAHLRAIGNGHFLVIVPAAVVTNWMREISGKTRLPGHRLHGPDRAAAVRSWIRQGGVGVTTFELLPWLHGTLPEKHRVEAVIVDEAHYIKNPEAKRTIFSRKFINRARHAILLTGTPMENRISEFANLVGYLRPDLTVDSETLSSRRFRAQVAPVYLRRNQEDVLTELPERVEVEEWLPMSRTDRAAYREAVSEGNFMAMRQAALLTGRDSEKLLRLRELVDEAKNNGRRVIVFSYFRTVLDEVLGTLPGPVFGPLTGSVPAAKRQQMVDDFSAARAGAVLVSQIEAGGVGLCRRPRETARRRPRSCPLADMRTAH
jgi:superfamily II DNA or RNA helicase